MLFASSCRSVLLMPKKRQAQCQVGIFIRRSRNNFGGACLCQLTYFCLPFLVSVMGMCCFWSLPRECSAAHWKTLRSLNIHFTFERPLTNQPLQAQSNSPLDVGLLAQGALTA